MPASSDGSGSSQHWDPERYQRNAGFVATLGEPLIELLAPQKGERILDLGCGDGALTEKLVATGAVNVLFSQALLVDGFESGDMSSWQPPV